MVVPLATREDRPKNLTLSCRICNFTAFFGFLLCSEISLLVHMYSRDFFKRTVGVTISFVRL